MKRVLDAWQADIDPFVQWMFAGREEYRPEQGLWAAVLQRAVMDYDLWNRGQRAISRGGVQRQQTNTATHSHYRTARAWIDGVATAPGGFGFLEACHALNLDPAAIRALVRRGLPEDIYKQYRAGSPATRLTARTRPYKIQARRVKRNRSRPAA